MMIRSFLPVGQGAFYCEKFAGVDEDINVVYDCGSLTNKSIVEREIRNNFRKGETVHAVFISHLDEDHINGVPFLLKYCDVKKIFFPLISEKNKNLMKLYNLIQYDTSFTYGFLENPNEAINALNVDNIPVLIQIRENEFDSNNFNDIRQSPSGENVTSEIIRGVKASGFLNRWLYIPHNFRQVDRVKQLEDALYLEFGKHMTNEDLMTIWYMNIQSDCDKIKRAYGVVKGSFNTNSMTLFSGEIEGLFRQYDGNRCRCYGQCGCIRERKSGCLYMGDYEASGIYKWNSIKNAYDSYWNHIGCIQIPHHGSKHNFNKLLLDVDAYFIISAGYNNRFRHPHAIVVKEILNKGCIPYIVTEHVGSAVNLNVL